MFALACGLKYRVGAVSGSVLLKINEMEKVFVVGVGTGLDAIEKAKKVLELKGDVEIICVETIEDIPFSERVKSVGSSIMEIHKYSAPPFLPVMTYEHIDKKKKGHERPYKYHR